MKILDLSKPVTIRGYTGRITSLEINTMIMTTSYYDIELVDLTPDENKISMRMVASSEVSTCV